MIAGSLVALVTPFRNDELDEDAVRNMVRWHIEQGTYGIVPVGTTGESATLTEKEHCRVIELVAEEAAGRIPIVAGAGSDNTREAIFHNDAAQDLGADATLHVAGYYNRPSQEGLFRHFEAVHAASHSRNPAGNNGAYRRTAQGGWCERCNRRSYSSNPREAVDR